VGESGEEGLAQAGKTGSWVTRPNSLLLSETPLDDPIPGDPGMDCRERDRVDGYHERTA